MPQPDRYRYRTPEVEAVQWTGSNADALRAFAGADFDEIELDDRIEDPDESAAVREGKHGTWRGLKPGDWVVRLDEGLYEFSAADFAERYESAGVSPATDQTALRDRIAAALYERERPPRDPHWPDVYASDREVFEAMADAGLSVLPASVDRADVLRWAADQIDAETRQAKAHGVLEPDKYRPCRDASAQLRRLAAEATPEPATEPEWARLESEEEKLAKARRMAKALSAPPVPPAEWATATEWPLRHKRRKDRRVHATAPFAVNGVQQIWTACEKKVGDGGYPVSHLAVDCRDCRRAMEAAEPEPAVVEPQSDDEHSCAAAGCSGEPEPLPSRAHEVFHDDQGQPHCVDDCPGCTAATPPAGGAPQPKEADGDRIVAYRSPLPGAFSIYCTRHLDELGTSAVPLTSDDLPDGGVCVQCHVDVLIPQPKEA